MNNPPEPYDRAAHSAWLESLSADESLMILTSRGHQHLLILIALTKRALLTPGIKPGEQLEILERMQALTDFFLRPEMLAMIEPAGETECGIIDAAMSLDPPDEKTCRASFEVLTRPRVFGHFCSLNPSILAAIKWREQMRTT